MVKRVLVLSIDIGEDPNYFQNQRKLTDELSNRVTSFGWKITNVYDQPDKGDTYERIRNLT